MARGMSRINRGLLLGCLLLAAAASTALAQSTSGKVVYLPAEELEAEPEPAPAPVVEKAPRRKNATADATNATTSTKASRDAAPLVMEALPVAVLAANASAPEANSTANVTAAPAAVTVPPLKDNTADLPYYEFGKAPRMNGTKEYNATWSK